MDKIEVLNKVNNPYEKYKFIEHHSIGEYIIDIVLLYPENEKFLLVIKYSKKIIGKIEMIINGKNMILNIMNIMVKIG